MFHEPAKPNDAHVAPLPKAAEANTPEPESTAEAKVLAMESAMLASFEKRKKTKEDKKKDAEAKATVAAKEKCAPNSKAKPSKRHEPRVDEEATRSHFLARTGLSGPGQNKCFKYGSGVSKAAAKKAAKKWLNDPA